MRGGGVEAECSCVEVARGLRAAAWRRLRGGVAAKCSGVMAAWGLSEGCVGAECSGVQEA